MVAINNVEWGEGAFWDTSTCVCLSTSRVNKTFRFYSNSQANTIFKAFVLPRLDWGNGIGIAKISYRLALHKNISELKVNCMHNQINMFIFFRLSKRMNNYRYTKHFSRIYPIVSQKNIIVFKVETEYVNGFSCYKWYAR